MPEGPEIETNEIREQVAELQEELSEEHRGSAWTRWIALSTALLAVVAAVGALQAGALVNEAVVEQIKASDTWNEYQAAREKEYLFTVGANALFDHGASYTPSGEPTGSGGPAPDLRPLPPTERLSEYVGQVRKEQAKEPELRRAAEAHEKVAEESLHRHHRFAWAVALIQVAIALAAVAALTRMRWVWFGSLAVGAVGLAYFVLGLLPAAGETLAK